MTLGVHQVLAGAAGRDAISNHALAAQDVIRRMGFRSEVFVDAAHIAPDVVDLVHPHPTWDAITRDGDLAILHYSIDSPAFGHVLARTDGAAAHYHNVTPPELLWRDAPGLAAQCRDGRNNLAHLATRVRRSAADSAFNGEEMEAAGLPAADVIGILRQTLPRVAPSRGGGSRLRLLFVGRGVPNKCQHDLILAVGALTETGVDAEIRLVGNWGGSRPYLERCRRLTRMLDIEDRVVILDSISDDELAGEYAAADVFVCLSEHEGYCVPLLEAMSAALPIVAFDAGAVPETLGAAGLLLPDKTPSLVAEAVIAVCDGGMEAAMQAGRTRQLAIHSREATAARLENFVQEFAAC